MCIPHGSHASNSHLRDLCWLRTPLHPTYTTTFFLHCMRSTGCFPACKNECREIMYYGFLFAVICNKVHLFCAVLHWHSMLAFSKKSSAGVLHLSHFTSFRLFLLLHQCLMFTYFEVLLVLSLYLSNENWSSVLAAELLCQLLYNKLFTDSVHSCGSELALTSTC